MSWFRDGRVTRPLGWGTDNPPLPDREPAVPDAARGEEPKTTRDPYRGSSLAISSAIGVPVVTCVPVSSSVNTPDRMATLSGSCLCVV